MPKRHRKSHDGDSNPLLKQQAEFLNSLSKQERNEFFDPSLDPNRRAEIWMEQADLGEKLVNEFSWATPSPKAVQICRSLEPLVEIGCGANAYWCKVLKQAGVDIVGYDVNVEQGGKISHKSKKGSDKPAQTEKLVRSGGPEVLSLPELQGKTLFLCYPDEDVDDEESEDENAGNSPTSMAWQCLDNYEGSYVIHVGELVTTATNSMDQVPWGRSSSPEFQQRLMGEFHCILQIALPNWVHTRDTLSVWKRSERITMVFEGDDSDDEEIDYRHIPSDERLPMDVAAPCMAHWLTGGKEAKQEDKEVASPAVRSEKPKKKGNSPGSQQAKRTDLEEEVKKMLAANATPEKNDLKRKEASASGERRKKKKKKVSMSTPEKASYATPW
eukprot:Nitzschia sp. Nitz4//scaffold212_size37733//19087//20241//NITZ4_007734-RA/size37733-processed-gene-0.35-mRNA-1//1//CDS//3329542025//5939//frame0